MSYKNKISAPLRGIAFLGALFSCSYALAHPGVHADGFGHGLAHPFAGLDHLAAMLAVGLWASQRGDRALWALPLSFVALLAMGAALGVAGVNLPWAEPAILASLLVLGLAVASAARLPLSASIALVGGFALFHGQAHGVEMPAMVSGVGYGLGFILASLLLHGLGVVLGRAGSVYLHPRVIQMTGAGVMAIGAYLSLT